ncbi:pentatricopeptide repeat-containing protein At3g26782, mitochondrial-like [Selaginella moellendorffii]|uniref:pentatricopeptide repeat-containing protein At3g26782, mitochondrial-like n=1 Tax=Selaginella moellendorffii TaxID=88036 RepID=UPI000D1CC948|nr:pentatricopeptide repeat-containing protein At3g26782, mitochondrial-like [Selaginella moellendorffii]|eukprot:XP_024529237.1 pentatricopeptide repeat-containing protein At3g26782, mitochondrial-like [Selaginella moellendorffii]
MQREGYEPNARTFVAALVACVEMTLKHRGKQGEKVVKAKCLEIGKHLHSQAARRELDSELFVASSLIDMYSKCGSVGEAWKAFSGIKRHDVVSWTTMILGYAENGDGKRALELFELMQARGCSPNTQTYLAALLACTTIVSSTEKRSDAEMKLLKFECLEKAMGIHSRALQTDIFVENGLLDLYAKCGNMLDARKVFDMMKCHNVVSWSALIHGYAQDEHESELAFGMFAAMKDSGGCLPDAQVYVAVLVACSNAAGFDTGKTLHAEICKQGHESNEFVGNSLVDFYGRNGRVDKAEQVFDSMPNKDLVSWSSLLAGFSRLGDATRVFQLFSEMREAGVQANAVTFQSVLSACSHAGLVEKGKKCFKSMDLEYGVKPGIEHYQCMIDLLGRASHLEEALAMVKGMPYEANVITWTTVLGACEKWKNVEIGRAAFNSLLELDEQRGAAYALMANLYERWNVGEKQRETGRDLQS